MGRVLVIGGTRFVGRLTAQILSERHDVVVLSRNALPMGGVARLIVDRLPGLKGLKGTRFDVVLDFIAYDELGVDEASALGGTYISISSTWMARVESPAVPTTHGAVAPSLCMPEVTREYLIGKAKLEEATCRMRDLGRPATAVRLPILLGQGDHTGRTDFYRSRIADGSPLLLVDGGTNRAQLLWSEDAARVLVALVDSGKAETHAVWEALPDDGRPVAQFVEEAARAMGRRLDAVEAPIAFLASELPAYLDIEPLWREAAIPRTAANLFLNLGLTATPSGVWLAALSNALPIWDPGRSAEVAAARRLASFPH